MRAQGLRADDALLDVGCGALRGGVRFVRYLAPGRYCGLDVNASLLAAGRRELGPELLRDKSPQLVVADDFDCAAFGRRFRLALAVSVFTHLDLNRILLCLVRVREVLAPDGRFFASWFEAPASGVRHSAAAAGGHRHVLSPGSVSLRIRGDAGDGVAGRPRRRAHRRLGPSPRPAHALLPPAVAQSPFRRTGGIFAFFGAPIGLRCPHAKCARSCVHGRHSCNSSTNRERTDHESQENSARRRAAVLAARCSVGLEVQAATVTDTHHGIEPPPGGATSIDWAIDAAVAARNQPAADAAHSCANSCSCNSSRFRRAPRQQVEADRSQTRSGESASDRSSTRSRQCDRARRPARRKLQPAEADAKVNVMLDPRASRPSLAPTATSCSSPRSVPAASFDSRFGPGPTGAGRRAPGVGRFGSDRDSLGERPGRHRRRGRPATALRHAFPVRHHPPVSVVATVTVVNTDSLGRAAGMERRHHADRRRAWSTGTRATGFPTPP